MGEQKRKSKRLVQLFVATMITLPLTGCGQEEIELCFDRNQDQRCDDDGSAYDPKNYVVKNGQRFAYIKSDSPLIIDDDAHYKKGIGGKSKGYGG